MFDEIIKREPLTQANLGDADLSKGAGVLSDNRKCIWTKDGHRITFTMINGGGILTSLSKEVDPAATSATGSGG